MAGSPPQGYKQAGRRRTDNLESAFVVKAATVLGLPACFPVPGTAAGCTTDELLGVKSTKTKRAGRKNKLDRYVEEVKKLPKAARDYVLKFLEQVVGRGKTGD